MAQQVPSGIRSRLPWLAARAVLLSLAASMTVLPAHDDKKKDEGKKAEPAKPAPARQEPRHEAPAPAPRPAPETAAPAPRPAPPAAAPARPSSPATPTPALSARPAPPGSAGQPQPSAQPGAGGRPGPSTAPGGSAPSNQPGNQPGMTGRPGSSTAPGQAQQPNQPGMAGRPGTPTILPGASYSGPGQAPGQPGHQTPGNAPGQPTHQGPGMAPGQPGHQPPVAPVHPDGRHDQPGTPSRPALDHGRPGGPIHGPEQQVIQTRGGGEIHRTPSGAIREVHTPGGAVIHHSPSGVRRVEIVRPGGRVIFANATGRAGYVQRPLMSHGHTFVQRTFVVNGVATARIYRPWSYGGREYHVYTPSHFYRPTFYVWASNPWARPVHYSWGWHARPWYGYYGGYFAPYPVYAGPNYWLADFLIATTLEAAFIAQNASYSTPPVVYNSTTGMTPEVKEAIAQEVRRQMDQERADQAAAQGAGAMAGPPPLFSDRGPRIFLVNSDVLAYAGNQECPLAEGDVLQLASTPSQGAEYVDVKILSSRGSACPRGSFVSVRTVDLQEMQNHMQATLDQGMAKLQADQGRDGIPAVPAQAMGTVNASYTDDIHPDSSALDDLSAAAREANQSEKEIISQGGQPAPAADSGGTITLGMSPAQVEAIMGRPKNSVDLGSKRIYIYKDLKVTFLDGRVSDVQ